MSNLISWRNPAAIFVVAAMLGVAAVVSLIAASDLNEASDGQATVGALTRAAANVELAWYQAMGADALAVSGTANAEAEGFYAGAINLYDENRAVLAAAGITEIDQALAGSDQGIALMNEAFAGTVALSSAGMIQDATDNHMDATIAIYDNVDPAVQGLALVAQAADAQLQSEMNSGATKLRSVSIVGLVIAAFGALYGGWLIYRRDDEAVEVTAEVSDDEPVDLQKAA